MGLDEIVVPQEIDLVNDTKHDWIEDCSELKVEFEPEMEEMNKQESTNLEVLEWLHDLPVDPKESILSRKTHPHLKSNDQKIKIGKRNRRAGNGKQKR